MRIIGEIPHPDCRITLFAWNNRYIIKLEKGYLEQTFKIDQFDLSSEKDLNVIVNEGFMREAMIRFEAMQESLRNTLENL
ncbi:MAG TPA: hypothetical protein PK325_05290 [Cyclobacteriaceae bacterium]|nr:hypothetical protein [Cyclobacteriaceae bacterium]HMV08631.1 hypothetical protein [Cyclobacteriaceae bacterium]HMV91348.1 hypothetical protein [Cyclobacteriaceae bacterium]HMX00160.1 hypothetical protein [Cyclobacteriaceae bacterium]HMX52226.1 hypothetical protein [Cyclobacteriaceae bacterium]